MNRCGNHALRVLSYNVHDCVGRDGRYAPERIAGVIRTAGADVVALQEVTLDHAGDVVTLLERETGLRAIDGTLFERGIGRYGNLLLYRAEALARQAHEISRPGREPRGVIEVLLETRAGVITVMATHLGLRASERRWQIARLAELVALVPGPLVVMGDFNVWAGAGALAPLRALGVSVSSVRTFPSRPWPVLALDRVMVRGAARLLGPGRVRDPLARVASDHLPLHGCIAISGRD